MTVVVHKLIRETAVGIANEAYESMAHDNAFFAEWPNRRVFVRKNWMMFVDNARDALLTILSGDYPEAMKQPAYEALTIDGSFRRTESSAVH
jgi:hypothetical protein